MAGPCRSTSFNERSVPLGVVSSPSVVNLTVHGIGSPSRRLEPDEDATWVSIRQFEQVLEAVADRPDVRLTFDDGNASDLDIALPRLVERGLKADFFVLAGLLGQPGRLDSAGVRELQRSGMSIGSHGWSHRDWRRLDEQQAEEEMIHANEVLGDIVGEPVDRVAIPFGSYDRHVLRRLRRARVARAYTSDGGPARAGSWLQARTSLRHNLDGEWIARVVDPAPPLRARARRLAARTVKRVRG
jgi:peptidoglycan/xylan/chitin deacetylase (PgdA/CDA1 family)